MDNKQNTNDFLTNKEAAQYIRSSEVTLWRLRREGLPFYRVQSKILFKKDDLDRYLRERRHCNQVAVAA